MDTAPCRNAWKGAMTPRERFRRQMHFQPFDRCFNMEFGYWGETFRTWDIFRDNHISDTDAANRFFNFDRIDNIGFEYWMVPPFPSVEVGVRGDRRILRNADGLLAEVPVDGHDTVPHFVKATVVTPDDWKKCKAERFRLDAPGRIPDVEAWSRAHPPGRDYPLGIYCGSLIGKVRDMLTFEGLAYAIYDYPEMVEDMVETCCQIIEQGLDAALGAVDFDYASGWEDICFKNGPIVSMDFFNKVLVPRYKRIGEKLHSHGVDVWYTDCDGDVRPFIPGFLDAGLNCLFPYEVNSCGHPADILREYGRDLLLMGGFDKLEMRKGPKAIDAYMAGIAPLVERGGFIPFCDHLCPPDITPENYLYYLDLKERTFGLP